MDGWTGLLLGRQVEEPREQAELRVTEDHLLEDVVAVARHEHDAAPHRPVGVLEVEHGRARVRAPRGPEQERPRGARRVVGELVEEAVQHPEAARQPRRHDREVVRGGAEVADGRLNVPGERPDLVADDRRGLVEERLRLAQRRGEVARERAAALERGAQLGGQRAGLAQRLLGLVERAGEQPQRLAQRGLLGGEGLEVRVRRVHQRGKLLVARRERGRELLEVVDHVPDVLAAGDQEPGDLLAVARGGLEALEDLAQVLRRGLVVARVGAGDLVVEGRAAGVQQDLEVCARVGVELRQELVGVHVRERVGHAHAAALGQLAGARSLPGSSARYMSFSPVFGRSRIVESR